MNQLVIDPILVTARTAASAWAARPVRERLRVIATARRMIVREARAFAAALVRPDADSLSAEVLPLLEAMRFLERAAPRLLRTRRPRGIGPLWLWGVRQEVRREPRGAVLILGPANYPLFLPGVQALQAIAAGNAACVKPAPGRSTPMLLLAELLRRAGLPEGVLQVLPEESGPEAMRAGFDYAVLTGSADTGRAVALAAAETLTPTAMELSGVDAVFVLPGADMQVLAASLAYGLRLNGGATCIAPRRVFVPDAMEADLLSRLLAALPPPASIPPSVAGTLSGLLAAAEAGGARVAARNPAVLAGARADMALLQQDVFAPWLALVPVADTEAALREAARCPYALGASIFGPEAEARALAARVRAGSVCINDLIVPTADPRLPFGGRGRSGFGVTRGAEGLLEMTAVKTVSVRHRTFRPHLSRERSTDVEGLLLLTVLLHGGWQDRWDAIRPLLPDAPAWLTGLRAHLHPDRTATPPSPEERGSASP